jgi:hypothetical protein
LFKTSEVEDYLGRSHHQVRQDFALTDSFPNWKKKFLEENTQERRRRNEVATWIESGPLDVILNQPLPPGIGTDDARIARNIVETVKAQRLEEYDAIVVLLFSGDRQLGRTTALMVKPWVKVQLMLGQLDKAGYTAICLEGVAEWQRLKAQGEIEPKSGNPRMSIRGKDRSVVYYNYLLRRRWWLPTEALTQLVSAGSHNFLRNRSKYVFHVEYDYPNMERGLDLIKYDPRTNSIREYGGGFLERRTVRGFGRDSCWSCTPYDALASWPDFDEREAKRYYRRAKYFKPAGVYIIDPLSPTTYRRVDQWRNETLPGFTEVT